MNNSSLPKGFQEKLASVKNRRARFVIDKILEKGFCSTEDLKEGGYEHAPRAARDVRELGIPLETFKIKDRNDKNIAAYRFGDWEEEQNRNQLSKTGGRTQLTEKLKRALIERYGEKCNLYGEEYPERLLQPDHRIPYEIGGDPNNMIDTEKFMLLSPSANRDKSWACEHCVNWVTKDIRMCQKCYYAYPENYEHIAGQYEKRVEIIFKEEDKKVYDNIVENAKKENISSQELIKRILRYDKEVSITDKGK